MWHFYIPTTQYQKEKIRKQSHYRIKKKKSIHETGHSKLVHWDNLEVWDGEGDGSGVWEGQHMDTCG